jgi:hypothetical protein
MMRGASVTRSSDVRAHGASTPNGSTTSARCEMNAPLSERQPRHGEGICEAYAERPLIRAATRPGHDR